MLADPVMQEAFPADALQLTWLPALQSAAAASCQALLSALQQPAGEETSTAESLQGAQLPVLWM